MFLQVWRTVSTESFLPTPVCSFHRFFLLTSVEKKNLETRPKDDNLALQSDTGALSNGPPGRGLQDTNSWAEVPLGDALGSYTCKAVRRKEKIGPGRSWPASMDDSVHPMESSGAGEALHGRGSQIEARRSGFVVPVQNTPGRGREV